MDVSIVVPLYNEEESLPELEAWIDRVMKAHNLSYEIVFVDDGSNDQSWAVIEQLKINNPSVKGIKFRRNYGKSPALHTGFSVAQGDVIITMDADLQDSPDEVPELYDMIIKEGFDVVSGWKKKRYDPFVKRITSKFYNWTSRRVTKIHLHDFNCGLKAYRREVIKSIEVYGEMHRYIPVLAKRAGFKKIGEKVVEHRARQYGVTKFGLERFINGFLDLLSVTFMTKFGKRPMHFFGVWGTIMFFLGFLVTTYLIAQKIYFLIFTHVKPRDVTDQPLFYLALVSVIAGIQLFLAGFLGELISRNGSDRNKYLIEKELK
ncbi:MAG: glycosyltransferase family 2 protein [Bacteroidales bacterium]|nr:glycosyltransferase family 2 protein [Bacteroidales bacterium]